MGGIRGRTKLGKMGETGDFHGFSGDMWKNCDFEILLRDVR
jgi:hypothetical protein